MARLTKLLTLALACCFVPAGCGAGSKDGQTNYATSNDIWQDEEGRFWSNEQIPVLYGMPKSVQSKMSDKQRKLINKHEDLIKNTTREMETVKNAFGLTKLESSLTQKQKEFSDQFNAELPSGKIADWVGRFRFDGSTKGELYFGNTSNWLTHGHKYPNAKDKDCAFVSEGFYIITFSLQGLPDDVQGELSTIENGDWVQVDGMMDLQKEANPKYGDFKESDVKFMTGSLYFSCWFQIGISSSGYEPDHPGYVPVGSCQTTIEWSLPSGRSALKLAKIKRLKSGFSE